MIPVKAINLQEYLWDADVSIPPPWHDATHLSIRIDQLEKIYFVLKAMEINSRPPRPSSLTTVKHLLAAIGISFAMLLSLTMLYISWIGFYPPSAIFHSIFFVDRLQDLKAFIENLKNGTIFAAFIDLFVDKMTERMQQRFPYNTTLPYMYPGIRT